MNSDLDLACAYVLLALAVTLGLGHAIHVAILGSIRHDRSAESSTTTALPRAARDLAYWALRPVARAIIAARISANTVTGASLVLAFGAAVLLAFGHFGLAAVAITVASLGDALDGLVARTTRTASPGGALFDASVDRYQEFLLLGGLAVFFRGQIPALLLALLALAGSFMVSYGSAKAEALHVPVPEGIMRRAERAVCLSVGVVLVPLAGELARRAGLPPSVGHAPILLALGLIAVLANVSAIRRLRAIAALAPAPARAPEPVAHVHEHEDHEHSAAPERRHLAASDTGSSIGSAAE